MASDLAGSSKWSGVFTQMPHIKNHVASVVRVTQNIKE